MSIFRVPEMFKLILLDYSMQDMNGPEVASIIRQMLQDSFVNKAYESGMDEVMTKPIEFTDLK